MRFARLWPAASITIALIIPGTARAQSSGSTPAAVAGAALGSYSGAMLALTGSLIPCGQTYVGPTCSGIAMAFGAAAGLAAGIPLGSRDSDRIQDRFEGAVIGAAVGALGGYALKGIVRQYGWLDVVSGAALGMAVGASGRGAGLGFLAGAAAGGVLLAVVPSVRIADAVGVGVAGLAIGGIMDWVVDAARTRGDGGGVSLSFSFTP